MTKRAALGFKTHTGWAAVVAVAEGEVVHKSRVDLAHTFEAGAVFHMGQALPFDRAKELIESSETKFEAAARGAIAAIVFDLREQGWEAIASGVVAGKARPLPPLDAILKSHVLVHTAEADLYRRIFVRGSETCGIPARLIALNDAGARAREIAAMGKKSGRPWAVDQKEAALAALIALGK